MSLCWVTEHKIVSHNSVDTVLKNTSPNYCTVDGERRKMHTFTPTRISRSMVGESVYQVLGQKLPREGIHGLLVGHVDQHWFCWEGAVWLCNHDHRQGTWGYDSTGSTVALVQCHSGLQCVSKLWKDGRQHLVLVDTSPHWSSNQTQYGYYGKWHHTGLSRRWSMWITSDWNPVWTGLRRSRGLSEVEWGGVSCVYKRNQSVIYQDYTVSHLLRLVLEK